MKFLTKQYQVARQPELPMMSWFLPDPPSHKGRQDQRRSVIRWGWYIQDQHK